MGHMNTQPRYSKEEFARRGDAIYDDQLRPVLEKANEGKFVAIDIETGAYEVDSDELAASDRLVARGPNAQIWLRRIGSRYARHFGAHRRSLHGMITGIVTDRREAVIRLRVRGPAGKTLAQRHALCRSTTMKQSKDIVRRFIDEGLNEGNVDAAQFVWDDVVRTGSVPRL